MSVIIKCKLPKGIRGIALFPFIFVIPDASDRDILHEKIHIRQQLEMLIIPFYIWYGLEFLIRRYIQQDKKAYINLSFEREARYSSIWPSYLQERKAYAWTLWL